MYDIILNTVFTSERTSLYILLKIQEGYETLRREAPQLVLPGMPSGGSPAATPSASNDMMRQMLQQMRSVCQIKRYQRLKSNFRCIQDNNSCIIKKNYK